MKDTIREMEIDKKIVKRLVQEARYEFKELAVCEECEAKKVPVKLVYGVTNTHGDGKECERTNERYICFECYKKMMSCFKDTELYLHKSFRPEYVFDGFNSNWIKGDEE